MANTRQHAVRVDEETWAAAAMRASLEHRNVSDVIRVALRAYGDGRYHATEPPMRRRK
jgi:hypothetical protein